MGKTKKATGPFKVGDWVSFPYGIRDVVAQVVEERGPIGVRGRHLYRVSLDREFTDPDLFEMPGEEMKPVPPPDKAAIIDYLKKGGLVDILRSNLGDGRNPPRVWLTYTSGGELTHTLRRERGVLGGAPAPYFALHETRVFKGKEDQVVAYLSSLGLSRAGAREVIAAVGTAP